MSERCERTSERKSERPSTPRVDFLVSLPIVYLLAAELEQPSLLRFVVTKLRQRPQKSLLWNASYVHQALEKMSVIKGKELDAETNT